MHTVQILWFFSLPVVIYLTYRLILFIVKKYEKKFPPGEDINPGGNS
jgi:hypothetical protein